MLRSALGEAAQTAGEQAMYADIVKRVRMWREIDPFYLDQKLGLPKSSESRAVEAVLDALFLVQRDNERDRDLSNDTRQAFANMWPLQMQAGDMKGGFAWLTFKLEPWESETADAATGFATLALADQLDAAGRKPALPQRRKKTGENHAALRQKDLTNF